MNHLIKSFIGAITILLTWLVGYLTCSWILDGLSANIGYSILTGWWLVAYVSSKFEMHTITNIASSVIAFVIAFCISLIGSDWFYHDLAGASILQRLLISLSHSFLVISPILFDFSIGWIVAKLKKSNTP